MRKSLLLWLLPVADIFAIHKILAEYRLLGVDVPIAHAKLGLVERWIGYLPAGFIMGWSVGFLLAFITVLVVFAVVGPIEFFMMRRGVKPWRFFRGKPGGSIAEIFLLEGYNAITYYLLGAALATLVHI
ncbi:MAG: hypothetical protein AB1305_05390 [Candidatus Hadarchaeota archaeon]